MKDDRAFSILGDIYEAALNPGRWKRALDGLASEVDASAIALMIRQDDPRVRDRQMLSSRYLDFTRTPAGLYYVLRHTRLQDPDWEFLSRQPAHQMTLDTDTGQTAEALDRRADYALIRKKLGLGRRLGIRLNGDRLWFDAVSLAFDASKETVPTSSMHRMAPFLPHLTKAVELGRTFSALKAKYRSVLSVLDRVKVGLAIGLPTGEIIVRNEEAARIFDARNGLRIDSNGHLVVTSPEQSKAINDAIELASQTAQGKGACAERLFSIERRSKDFPFLLDVAPLRDSKAEMQGLLDGALITIIDPENVPQINMSRFNALYGLTSAEAEVCQMLVQGLNAQSIAQRRDTAPVTTKNQIASIFAKTNVSRQAELVRLVFRVIPPVE